MSDQSVSLSDTSVVIRDLTKTYGTRTVLKGVNLSAAPGEIVGFVGPNGSGKTTTLRILLGLARASAGSALIDGRRYVDLEHPGRFVGAVLDGVEPQPRHTAWQHLTVHALSIGVSPQRVPQLLERVGLLDRGKDKVRTYSLGMRRRLGLARALLGDPRVLVLDEPANGLDPVGSRWLRDFLRSFAADGGTVLISSHVLTELERIVDSVVLIRDGQVLASGRVKDLVGESTLDDFYLDTITKATITTGAEG